MFPIRDQLPPRRQPLLSRSILIACAAAFVLTMPDLEAAVTGYGAIAAQYTGADKPWSELLVRSFTHMFLHGSGFHLLSNLWFLWIFGDNVEDRLGHRRFLVFYVLCGLAALAAQVVAEPRSTLPMIGASGAISGVLGAYLVYYPTASILTLVPFGFVPLLVQMPAMFFLLYWAGLQLLMGLADGGQSGVAFWAHAGGFVAGVLLALPFAPRAPRRARIQYADD
jgi:membrane associated rhomboid family serine protease